MLDLVRRHNNFVTLLKNMKIKFMSISFNELVSFETHKFRLVSPFSPLKKMYLVQNWFNLGKTGTGHKKFFVRKWKEREDN